MHWRLFAALWIAGLVACSAPVSPPESDPTDGMLGRWDVTAVGDGETFPMWFELARSGTGLTGRLQGRSGHALDTESVEVSGGAVVTVKAGPMSITGELTAGGFQGTGDLGRDRTISWKAVRAPELPKPADPKWGEAVALFNGTDLTGWRTRNEEAPNLWVAENGVLANQGRGADLITEPEFGDFKLHIEVSCPEGSNSGIYMRGRYEVQVEASYGAEPHSRRLGGVYGHLTPTENAARPAGEWQVFDITLLGRWITVQLNGVTIIDDQEIPGPTGGALDSNEAERGPIMIQGDHGAVSYRNIQLTPVIG